MNDKILDYLGVTAFHEAGYFGQGQRSLVAEGDPDQHYQDIMALDKLIAPLSITDSIFVYTNMQNAVEMAINDSYSLVNCSFSGSRADQNPDDYRALVDKTILVCAAGNSGKAEYKYPASHFDSLSVANYNIFFYKDRTEVKIDRTSTINDRIDIGCVGEWMVNGHRVDGSSFASPAVFAMIKLFKNAFVDKYGVQPSKAETLAYVFANSKTGVFRLDLGTLRYIWSSKQQKYIDKDKFLENARR